MQKLIVDNFKQITHAEIEVKDFLLLIGPQASGKSTIAKLIFSSSFSNSMSTSSVLIPLRCQVIRLW